MKISLKFRVAIVLLLIMMVYSFGLLGYYRFYALGRVAQDMNDIKEHFAKVNDWFLKQAAELHKEPETLYAFLDTAAAERGMFVQLYDTEGRLIFQSDHRKSRIWDFKSREVIVREGKALYYIEFHYPIQKDDVLGYSIAMRNMVSAAILFIGAGILFLIGYLQYVIVEPLLKLHRHMSLVNFRNPKVPAAVYKKRPDEIGELYKNFEKMMERLENARKEQTAMISAISHDLKTPLTSILGYVERLSDGKVKTEEKKQEYYEIIHRKAKDIEQLIEDFSTFSQNDRETENMEFAALSARAFFKSICQEYEEEVKANHADFSFWNDIPESTLVYADEKKLRRVFANLVSNALHYVEPKVHIHMTGKVLIRGDFVEFAVEDNGNGVPEEMLPLIFKKFYRTDPSRSRESGGSGLGLAICKRIVDAHGGRIEAYRKPQGGFGVKFSLPIVK